MNLKIPTFQQNIMPLKYFEYREEAIVITMMFFFISSKGKHFLGQLNACKETLRVSFRKSCTHCTLGLSKLRI